MNRALEASERGDFARPPGTVPAAMSRGATLPATVDGIDPLMAFAAEEAGTDIIGYILKFSKGDWLARDKEVPAGSEFLAAVDHLVRGWQRWEGSKPVERRLGRVADGFREAHREELGHTDMEVWERDRDGKPVDPWQKTRMIPLKRLADGELHTLILPGRGRAGEAIGKLAGAYARSRARATDYPIVRLGVDSYQHAEFGRIKFPTLSIAGWRPRVEFGELETGDADLPASTDRVAPSKLVEDAIPF